LATYCRQYEEIDILYAQLIIKFLYYFNCHIWNANWNVKQVKRTCSGI